MITIEQVLSEPPPRPLIHYPESDGQPIGDNDQQRDLMAKIIDNLKWRFSDRNDVYVSGNLFWYPVEGNNRVVQAPDTMVVFGRPPGLRGCYKQWEEGNIAPQVVFEILSPNNTPEEMIRKRAFYQKYGCEEYYVLDPEAGLMEGWLREGAELVPLDEMDGWRSPRLGIAFHRVSGALELRHPDGRPFAEGWEGLRRAELLAAKLRAAGIDPEEC